MKIELLKTPGCEHSAQAEALVRDVLGELAPAAALEVAALASVEEAVARRFAGSPTILVDGADMEPDATVVAGFG